MVGGIIIETRYEHSARVWVNVRERRTDAHKPETCAIFVNPIGEPIRAGDSLWWQGGYAYWTPISRTRTDVKLPRIGFSGVSKPDVRA